MAGSFWSVVKVWVRFSNARHAEAEERVGRECSSLLGGWNRLCGKLLNWGIDHTQSATTTKKLPWKTQRKLEKLGGITFDDLQGRAEAEQQWNPECQDEMKPVTFTTSFSNRLTHSLVLSSSHRMSLYLVTQSVQEKTKSSCFVSVTRNTH